MLRFHAKGSRSDAALKGANAEHLLGVVLVLGLALLNGGTGEGMARLVIRKGVYFFSWASDLMTCGFNKFIFGSSDLRTRHVVSMSSPLASFRSSTMCSGIFHQVQFQMKYELLAPTHFSLLRPFRLFFLGEI